MTRFFAALLVAAIFIWGVLFFTGYTLEITWDDGPHIRIVSA